jgi:hypothetical protein
VWNGEGGGVANHDITITNNGIDQPRKDGILIVGSPQNNFSIENNNIYDPNGQGVNVVDAPTNSAIDNNQVLPQSSYPGDGVPVGSGATQQLEAPIVSNPSFDAGHHQDTFDAAHLLHGVSHG